MFLFKYILVGLLIAGMTLYLKRRGNPSILESPPSSLYQSSSSLVAVEDQSLFNLLEVIAEERALKLFYRVQLTTLLNPRKTLTPQTTHNALQVLKKYSCDFALTDKNHHSPLLIILVAEKLLKKEPKKALSHLSNDKNQLQSILQATGLPFISLSLKKTYTKQILSALIDKHLVR